MDDAVHIIGAGLIGLSTADSLMDRGRRVVIWDRASAPGLGASFLNSALLHPSQAAPWVIEGLNDDLDADALDRLTREGMELSARSGERLARRRRDLGLSGDARGLMQIFGTCAARDRRLESYARHGVVAEATSWIGHPAIDIPDDSVADAQEYTTVLADDLARRGAVFRMGRDVHLSRGADGGVCLESGDFSGDFTSTRAQQVVVAAGHHTGALLGEIGLESDVEAVSGHGLRFRKPDRLPPASVMHADSRSALTVLPDHVRISGGVGLSAPGDLLPIWNAVAAELIAELGQPVEEWTGHRPVTRSGRPLMGETPVPGLFVNAGHAHMGWTLSAGAGEVVAEAVTGAVPRQAVL